LSSLSLSLSALSLGFFLAGWSAHIFAQSGVRGKIALGRHFQIGQCAPQHRQQPMNPVVGLRLAQSKLQAVQGLQRRGLLIDQNEQQFVFKRLQSSLGTTARLAVARFALRRLIRRAERNVGGFKG
jgi:hypothetical protein